MKWIAILSVFVVLTSSALAAGSDEQYLDIYNEISQADALQDGGHNDAAALRYLQAQTDLQKLQTDHPDWNPDIVKYRLDYLADKLQALQKFLPVTNAPPAAAPAPSVPVGPAAIPAGPAAPVAPDVAALQQQNAGFQEQIRSLTDANTELQGKLKEALTVQPAAVSPDELAKAEAKIVALQKERDLLAVALDQEKASNASAIAEAKAAAAEQAVTDYKAHAEADESKAQAELAVAKEDAAESEKKLAAANKELDDLKASRAAETDEAAAAKARAAADEKKAEEEMAQVQEAGLESVKILDAAGKELELLKEVHPPEVEITEGEKQIPEERDQLKQLMAEVSNDEAEITLLKESVADGEKKLAVANDEVDSLKAAHPAEAPSADSTKAIIEERDQLKEELAERSKDLADAETHHSQELLNMHEALQKAEQRRDELEKQLAAASPGQSAPAGASPGTPALAQQVEQLQARVAVLEATPVPYTEEEVAILKSSPPPPPAAPPTITSPAGHVYSSKDLPPGSGPLWADALRASMEHDYVTAEQKFNDVLQQDPNNVYVLAYLANAQFAAGQLADCEKSVQHALAVDPEDAGSLYLLGVLRYRQDRLDEALDALSRSAKFNPTNAATQNFLGCVLADKGLRAAAETALRKALETDPDYAEAHFNLAVVYVGNQPPSMELARWHYKRAVALGHAKNDTLEKLLAEGQ